MCLCISLTAMGFWPAFWLYLGYGVVGSNQSEIDIFEPVGRKPKTEFGTNIWLYYCGGCDFANKYLWDECSPSCPQKLKFGESEYVADYTHWHKYGIEWTPTKIIWYVDDVAVRTFPNPGAHDEVRVILNLAIDYYLPNSTTPFPSEMVVDYVKVYKYRDDSSTPINSCAYNFSSHDNKVKKKHLSWWQWMFKHCVWQCYTKGS